jgi:mono/diheme cytochrome c family protein
MLRHRSIAVRSEDIQAPDLDDAKLKEAGFAHYHEMCRLCHGAPDYRLEEFAQGLYPAPPSMTSGFIQKALSDAKICWIVKNGIKMTGMPAFGPTQDEEELWSLIALVKEMPRISPEQYRQLVELTKPGEEHH